MKAAIVAMFVLSVPALACVPDDYQQVKDELAAHGRPAMVKRYCAEFQLVKSALAAEVDFSASARSRAEARGQFDCHNANLSRMQTALGAATDSEILAGCAK